MAPASAQAPGRADAVDAPFHPRPPSQLVRTPPEEVPLRCGGDGGDDELQVGLEVRKLAYLRWARRTNARLGPGGEPNIEPFAILGYLSGPRGDGVSWSAAEWDGRIERALADIVALKNDSDMGLQAWVRLLYLDREEPRLPAAARRRIVDALTRYRYWIDEPFRGDAADPQQFWTENHQLMYSSAEFLIGQMLPAERFDGRLNGAQRRDRARQRVDRWLHHRLNHGFNEWNSPGYYDFTFTALLNLVDFSDDDSIARRAAMALDLMIFDYARFTQNGSFGVTAGRSYGSQRSSGWRQTVGDAIEMLFGTRGDWVWPAGAGATSLATTRRYCVPTVLLAIGRDRPRRFVDRSRVSIDPGEVPDIGYATDDDGLFWWGKSAYFLPPMHAKTLDMAAKYNVRAAIFPWHNALPGHVDRLSLAGVTPDRVAELQRAVSDGAAMSLPTLAPLMGLFQGVALTRANLYTYRDRGAMLSSVQRFRVGQMGGQVASWQVAFDPEVSVFGQVPNPLTPKDPWTGTLVHPFVAQRDSAAIAVYNPGLLGLHLLDDRTQLWFPTGRLTYSADREETQAFNVPNRDAGAFVFDEWAFRRTHRSNDVRGSVWMFGRKGDGYVGIYSARPCRPATTGLWVGKQVVCDGARNAFVIQVGSAETFGSFAAFIEACVGARIHIGAGLWRPDLDVQVSYDSPDPRARAAGGGRYRLEVHHDKGEARFNGQPLQVDGFPRFENPYAAVRWMQVDYRIAHAGMGLRHHVQQQLREGEGLRPGRALVGDFDQRIHGRGYVYLLREGGVVDAYLHRYIEDRRPDAAARGPSSSDGPRIASFGAGSARIVQAGTTQHRFGPRRTVATGWQSVRRVVPAMDAAFFTLTGEPAMAWVRHDGFADASPRWSGPVPVRSLPPVAAGGVVRAAEAAVADRPAMDAVGAAGSTAASAPTSDTARPTGPIRLLPPQVSVPPVPRDPRERRELRDGGDRHGLVSDRAGPAAVGPARTALRGDWTYVGAGEGVVYAIRPDGTLLWMRHTEPERPAASPESAARVVGTGWNRFVLVFAGGDGVLYAVEPDGTLRWYRHVGFRDGSGGWDGPTTVGRGWAGYKAVVGGGDGDLYALDAQGRLFHRRHLGSADGSDRWTERVELGRVGDARALFALLPTPVHATLR